MTPRALITGANGFLGSRLIRHLVKRGERVKAFVRAGSNLSALRGLPEQQVELCMGDILSGHTVYRALAGLLDEGLIADGVELGRADKPGVSFEFLPNLSSARQLLFRPREVDRQMEQAVRDADAVVARLPSEIGFLAVKHARRLSKP